MSRARELRRAAKRHNEQRVHTTARTLVLMAEGKGRLRAAF
jgi:hypothetical protein